MKRILVATFGAAIILLGLIGILYDSGLAAFGVVAAWVSFGIAVCLPDDTSDDEDEDEQPTGITAFQKAAKKLKKSAAKITSDTDREALTEALKLMRRVVDSDALGPQELAAYEFTRQIGFVQVVVDGYLENQTYGGLARTGLRQHENRAVFWRFNEYAKNHMEQLLEAEHAAATFERERLLSADADDESELDLAS